MLSSKQKVKDEILSLKFEHQKLMLSNCVLEKTLESLLDSKKIEPVNPKETQPWIFIRRTDAEAEAPILWVSDVKNWVIGKDPDAGKDRGQEKAVAEDEIVRWHHQLQWLGFEQTLGDTGGQRSPECCSPWGRVGHHLVTEQQQLQNLHIPFV